MKIINNDSFKAESSETTGWGDTFEVGTVEVTLWGETKTVPAKRTAKGYIYITSGIGGKYRTSMKVWKASVSNRGTEHDSIWFGRDDRNMNFTKNSIFFSDKV
jgi:hypothetical protein